MREEEKNEKTNQFKTCFKKKKLKRKIEKWEKEEE